MKDLIRALTILKHYLEDENARSPLNTSHDTLWIMGMVALSTGDVFCGSEAEPEARYKVLRADADGVVAVDLDLHEVLLWEQGKDGIRLVKAPGLTDLLVLSANKYPTPPAVRAHLRLGIA